MPGPNDLIDQNAVIDEQLETDIAPEGVQPEDTGDAQPEAAPAPTDAAAKPDPKVRQVTQRELAQLRRNERLTGRNSALEALQRKATELGYASVEEMIAAAPKKTGQQTQAPTEEAPQTTAPKPSARLKELENANQLLERKLRRERDEKLALKKDIELSRVAREQGIQDEEYALHMLRKHVRALDPTKAAKVDPAVYFQGLRKTHGFLFGEQVKVEKTPASTSPAAKTTPAAPKAAEVAQSQSNEGQVDTTTMSKAEFDAYMAKKGIRNPRFLS